MMFLLVCLYGVIFSVVSSSRHKTNLIMKLEERVQDDGKRMVQCIFHVSDSSGHLNHEHLLIPVIHIDHHHEK